MFDYVELYKIFITLTTLGYDVSLDPCNDGLKVKHNTEGWDFAINSLTMGHKQGLVESYGFGEECVGNLDAKQAVAMVLSK